MRSSCILAAALAGVASSAAAQEALVAPPYPGSVAWKEIAKGPTPNGTLRERIPGDQQTSSFKDILSETTFPALKAMTPQAYLGGLFQHMLAVCEGARVNGPRPAQEGGHAVAYGQIYCGRWKGEAYGLNIIAKVIQGEAAIYVVQREFHVPVSAVGGQTAFPPEQKQAALDLLKASQTADSYLTTLSLCGGGGEPACTASAAP